MSSPPGAADRIYRLLLRVYPPDYLETFGDEMHQTFREGAHEARSQGRLGLFLLRELMDVPQVLANAYWDGWKRKLQNGIQTLQEVTSSDDLPPAPPDGRGSRRQAFFEMGPFLIAGLLLIFATYLPFDGLRPGWQRDPEFLGKVILPLALPILLLGLSRGLPRWAYPFAGLLFGYQAMIAYQTSLWLFLIPMLLASVALALAAIMTDPQPALLPVPLRRIGQSLSADWTRLSFAFYGALPWVILRAFDDSHYDNRTPYLALSVLMMVIGALFYCRSRAKTIQIGALVAGLTLSIWGALLDRIFFAEGLMNWISVSSRGSAGNIWILELWLQWMIIILSPTLLLMFGRALHRKRAM